jgi:hypothetical protein
MVCQVGWAGIKLGRIDLQVDTISGLLGSAYIAPKVS